MAFLQQNPIESMWKKCSFLFSLCRTLFRWRHFWHFKSIQCLILESVFSYWSAWLAPYSSTWLPCVKCKTLWRLWEIVNDSSSSVSKRQIFLKSKYLKLINFRSAFNHCVQRDNWENRAIKWNLLLRSVDYTWISNATGSTIYRCQLLHLRLGRWLILFVVSDYVRGWRKQK